MNAIKTKLIQLVLGRAGEVVRWVVSAAIGTAATFLADKLAIQIPDDVLAQVNVAVCAAVLFVLNAWVQQYQAKQGEEVQKALNATLPVGEKLTVDGWIGEQTMKVVKAIPVE